MNKYIPTVLKVLSLFFFALSATLQAWPFYSNNQGILGATHDSSFVARIRQNFAKKEGAKFIFDEAKAQEYLDRLILKKDALKESFYLSEKLKFITNYNLSDKKASKKARDRVSDDARSFFAFEFVTSRLSDLILNHQNLSDDEIYEEISNISVVIESIDFIYQDNLFRNDIRSISNLIVPFHTIKKNDSWANQATNLYMQDKFLSPEDIKLLMSKGVDISKIDPPSSSFWTNNNIEGFDVYKDDHLSEQVFPKANDIFVFDRFGGGNIKIKADVYPQDVGDPCKADVDNTNTTIRLGHETNNQLISTNLARAIGYPYIPHQSRDEVLMYLCHTSFESFLQQWEKENQDRQGSFLTHGEYVPELHAVKLKNLALEGYPGADDNNRYRKGGTFRTESMGLENRREFRSLVIFNGLIALVDATERNVRIDFHRPENQDSWNPLIFINDLGRSLGHYLIRTHGTVNDFGETFVKEKEDEIRLWWDHLGYNSSLFSQTTFSDARWIVRRLARLSNKQIDDIVDNSQHARPVKELYKVKLKKRILNLMTAFKLDKEIATDYVIPSYTELHRLYPKYIDEKGKITYEADQIQGVSARPRGVNTSLIEVIQMEAINQIFNLLSNKFSSFLSAQDSINSENIEIFGGTFDLGFGIRLSASRGLSINPEKSENEKRFLIKDTILISLPLGLVDKEVSGGILSASLPVGAQYTYSFDFFHSVVDLKKAVKTDFFKRLIPWRASSLQSQLAPGEGLYIEHSVAKSLGELSLEANENFAFSVAPLSFKTRKLKQTYFYRVSPELLEVADSRLKESSLGSNLNLTAYLSLSAHWSRIKSSGDYSQYRFFLDDFSGQDQESLNDLALKVLNDEDNIRSQTYAIASSFRQSHMGGCFFVWCRNYSNSFQEFDITDFNNRWTNTSPLDHTQQEQNSSVGVDHHQVFISSFVKSSDRQLSRIWNDDLKLGPIENIFNLLLSFSNEGSSHRLKVEATWNEETHKLENIDLRAQLIRRDNFLKKDEVSDWENYFTSRAYCGNQKNEDYLNISQAGIDYFSPISAVMVFQIKEEAILKIIKSEKNKFICKRNKRCQRLVNTLLNQRPKTKSQAQKYIKTLMSFFKDVLGKDFSQLGCLKDDLKKRDYWLLTKVVNPLDYTTPIARGNADLFAQEMGKFQGHSFLEDFIFQSYLKPIIARRNISALRDFIEVGF